MSESALDPALRREIKEAVAEALRDEREALQGLLVEVIEDAALGEAIRRGRESDEVTRDEVFSVLRQE